VLSEQEKEMQNENVAVKIEGSEKVREGDHMEL
jgi:hypothetical protein